MICFAIGTLKKAAFPNGLAPTAVPSVYGDQAARSDRRGPGR